jgi:hypothetical protein
MSKGRRSAVSGIGLVTLLWIMTVVPGAFAQSKQSESTVFAAVRTGKERLSDKASDEQRVDDCKVSRARRTRSRPTSCPWDAGS